MALIEFQTREQRRDIAWAKYESGYNAARDEAIAEKHCFCACGCVAPVESLSYLGGPVRCPECRKRKDHYLTRPPVETFHWERYESAPPAKQPPRPRVQLSVERRNEAGEYVRKYGRRGFKSLVRLHERLVSGKPLTDPQAELALRSKAADERDDARAAAVTEKAEWKARKAIDLNRVVVPETVVDGLYAVRDDAGGFVRIEVDRPVLGLYRGFVMVTLSFGDSVVQRGLQYPQPWRALAGYAQTYRGESAHLVAALVDNPEKARTDYQEAVANG